ncbi:hypothetical protein R6Z07F_011911 [Ovis aries]
MSKREFRILQDGKGSQQEAGQYRKQRYWRDEGEVVQSTQKPRSSAWITFHDSKLRLTGALELGMPSEVTTRSSVVTRSPASERRKAPPARSFEKKDSWL